MLLMPTWHKSSSRCSGVTGTESVIDLTVSEGVVRAWPHAIGW